MTEIDLPLEAHSVRLVRCTDDLWLLLWAEGKEQKFLRIQATGDKIEVTG